MSQKETIQSASFSSESAVDSLVYFSDVLTVSKKVFGVIQGSRGPADGGIPSCSANPARLKLECRMHCEVNIE
jgi:hypothetical protein